MKPKQSIEQITALIEKYFEGLYQADPDKLSLLFHPQARYVNSVKNDYVNYSITEYLSVVSKRVAPAKSGTLRDDRIISIEHDGDQMAMVKLSMTMLDRRYLDYLTLIFNDERWLIISKVFSYKIEQGN